MALKESIETYMDAGYPILYINTFEEAKAEELLKEAEVNQKIYVWSKASGLYIDGEHILSNGEGVSALSSALKNDLLSNTDMPFLLVIKDAHIALDNEDVKMELKEFAIKTGGKFCRQNIVLISPNLRIPIELEKYITILEDDYLNPEEISDIIQKFIDGMNIQNLNEEFLSRLASALKGLSEYEILNFLSLATVDNKLTNDDLDLIFKQKKQMILKSGTLEMVESNIKIDDIGGLENLKDWLKRKEKIVKDSQKAKNFGVDMPKGVLIAGVPGCGKSLCAKATAALFEIPLLRLDIGKLMGKYLGESEANLRKAIKLAGAISPCVLWVDELEKAFAGIGSNDGNEVTTRLFGTFLTWMQEKSDLVFVVATANDITKLPPELLRKGRFDEIFYVDLPNKSERETIFEIHIKKRRENAEIDTKELADKTDGYSGADIEGVVKEAVEAAFVDNGRELTTKDIISAIQNTDSLSAIMKTEIEKMRKKFTERKMKKASR